MERGDVAAARALQRRNRGLDLGHRRHAGRNDHRLSRGRAGFEKAVPQQLVGRDLVERDEGFELLDRGEIEGRAGKFDVARAGALGERREMSDGQLPLGARAVLGALRENFRGEQFGDAEELELHRVATAVGRRVDKGERAGQILTVIARCFRDEFDRHAYPPHLTRS